MSRRKTPAATWLALWLALAWLLATPGRAAGAAAEAPPGAQVLSDTIAVVHAAGDAGYAREVAHLAAQAQRRIGADLGLEHRGPVTLLLLSANSPAADREAWARRLPSWSAGAAVSAERLIVIRVRPGQTPRELAPLLAHELTHVVLEADFPGYRGWPAWFQEALAMRESRTEGLRDRLVLSAAALFDRLLPFESLAVSFPADERLARLAYAQSVSFLGFLDAEFGAARSAKLLRALRAHDFEDAFRATYGVGPGAAEARWLRWANRRYAWVPAVTSETTFWLLITLLFFAAIAARRRRSRLLRERWEAEERLERDDGGDPPA